jgi:hypothetical protein
MCECAEIVTERIARARVRRLRLDPATSTVEAITSLAEMDGIVRGRVRWHLSVNQGEALEFESRFDSAGDSKPAHEFWVTLLQRLGWKLPELPTPPAAGTAWQA